ncbi:MAG TPA: T9SS type A sorting domain-containing protein, partial [Puia sp.]|nr:T9SS type A sorting domain-containing protein [Puia sp.]
SSTGYEIMQLVGDSMVTIGTTIADTNYLVQGLNRDSSYWFSVRADFGASAGRRAVAVNITPTGGSTCALSNDLTIDSLIAPITGRMYTSTRLSNATTLGIELKNLGGISTSGTFPVSYQINGGTVVTETISSSLSPHSAFNYTFGTPFDFSAPGSYTIKAWVTYPSDTLHANDTLVTVIKNLQNDPLTLNPSFTEGFESATAASYLSPTRGFTGLDRCDFFASSLNGRARTFVDNGFARTGSRSAILDVMTLNSLTSDSLVTTFNLSNYTSSDQIWLNFYVRNQGIEASLPGNQVWIRGNDQAAWVPVYTLPIDPATIGLYTGSPNIDITGTLAKATPSQTISSSFQILFGEEGYTSANSVIPDGNLDNGYSFDDITITRASNDVGMNALISPTLKNFCFLSNAETISVKVTNYSSAIVSNVPVSYSINGGTAVTESIPSIPPKDSIIYTFSQTADLSLFQNYNLSFWVSYPGDTYPLNDSLLNINFNTTPIINSYPYLEGFENNNGYWYTGGTNSSWQWGAPEKTIINKAANGNNAWVTSLTGNYNNFELSYLYSPCFDLSSLTQPVFSFSHIFQTEDDCDCDYHWAEYSTDDSTWIKLGAEGGGTNWYDDSINQTWQKSYTKWHVSSYDVPTTAAKVRFRIVMSSDPATNFEGVGVDDVHIFDKAPVYSGANVSSGLSQVVTGSTWVDFGIGNTKIASINANGQNLGNTTVKVFINKSGIRHTFSQYYLDRNIVVQPASQPTDSVSVRFYFLDSEADSLINATGCSSCTTIADAYESGVTQYSNDPTHEDSTLNDNSSGNYRFIKPREDVSIIPNDNGYYAEYKVTGFSEFWINNGGITNDQPLPIILETFTATLYNVNAGLLRWTVGQQSGVLKFVVQKSTDGTNFTDLGQVNASPNTITYQFIDDQLLNGNNYYRLVITDSDGNIDYSPIRDLIFDQNAFSIAIFPNPVKTGMLYINTSVNCNNIEICDVSGRILMSNITSGLVNSVSLAGLSKGIYLAIVTTDNGKKVAKIVVE